MAAALAALTLSVGSLDGVWRAPSESLIGPATPGLRTNLSRTDQEMVLATIAYNARAILEHPWSLGERGQCYPFPRSYTLGEHMFGSGLLATLPWALSHDPVFTYNALLTLIRWIAALALYALAFHFTRDAAASFVGAVLFSLARIRLENPVHPYVTGDLWIPFVLLFLHRSFVERRVRDVAGLVLFSALQLAESLYAVLACAIVAGTYGLALALRGRRLLAALPRLLPAAGAVAGVAFLLFAPYLETARTWGGLERQGTLLLYVQQFRFGGNAFPGGVLLGLAAIGLAGRLWRRRACRHGEDPRVPIALATFFVLWCSVWAMPLPPFGLFRSPLLLARDVVPGLDSVRALGSIRVGISVGAALLAAYGMHAIAGRARPAGRALMAALVVAAALAEQFVPALARSSFHVPLDLAPYQAAPPPEDRALIARCRPGAVLDLPFRPKVRLVPNAHALLLAAYHGQPTAACYNSFPSPLEEDLLQLAQGIPELPALDAIAALGFRNLLLHREFLLPLARRGFETRLARAALAGAPIRKVAASSEHVLYWLRRRGPVSNDLHLLEADRIDPPWRVAGRRAEVRFTIRNRGSATFHHPAPLRPTSSVLRWRSTELEELAATPVRTLLPLAIGPGGALERSLEADVPVGPGTYVVELETAEGEPLVLSRRLVLVLPEPRSDAPPSARERRREPGPPPATGRRQRSS